MRLGLRSSGEDCGKFQAGQNGFIIHVGETSGASLTGRDAESH